MNHHIAIYISNKDNKLKLIERIQNENIIGNFSNSKGALFSEITINKLIEEERNHGKFLVDTETKNSLENSSLGERKKALIKYIIAQNPEYIIVDNILGNLDVSSQDKVAKTITNLSEKAQIIQISNRSEDILPFISKIYHLEDDKLVELNLNDISNTKSSIFLEALPKAYRLNQENISPIIKFEDVNVSYGERSILHNINWEIKKGEFWQLIGPNGSGKSTILSMIYGDNPKAFGQNIVLFGKKKGSGESVWDIKQKIGYFSSDMLRGFKRLDSIGNMIASGFFDTIGLYKTPTNDQIKIAQQWLHILGLFDIRKEEFLSLSRGYQSLVMIARAMVKHPPLLILDEPTNGLDDRDVKLFVELINKIAKESETAILYVSHRKEEGLKPDLVYKLSPHEMGSTGSVVTF